ncbi:hypothetical protein FFI89_023170 [Bradyrhizobium sp. KBS0727]|uniref:hypothetical protein n=1 Tax=unclassified Bradyrhizobium TaxID=2631580 RepID=UPI00110ED47F|nr:MULTISPECIES: hypothetical protein [unclassified Bradyrhizobium]QDW39793.1 hypothetical protein FFI71_023175 [Bradyrhizobium sp. KBS0725]QDW46396.1 hypothetical protein FFI89_023170 [Bradyrhizobium sp. KBS0727]
MTTTLVSQVPAVPYRPAAELKHPRRNVTMLVYVTLSLFMTMSVLQTTAIERGSWQYFAYVSLAILPLLVSFPEIFRILFGRCGPLFVMLLLAGSWEIFTGDVRAAAQLLLLVFITAWVSTDRAALDTRDLARLYIALILTGVIILSAATLNPYSLIPGRALPDFGIWRVSFFPNIAYSGMLSLALLLVLTRDAEPMRGRSVLIAVAGYFLVFSFVRAALIAALMYVVLRLWFGRWREPRPRLMFWIALFVAFGFVIAMGVSANILYRIQEYSWVSTLLLRGEKNLTVDAIAYQLYRPWLWDQQWSLFASSRWLMGWGSADFYGLVAKTVENPDTIIISEGSEALPTRLLVVYGLPGLLFTVYLVARLRALARTDDRWACACFPPLFTLMMTWGSVFHPSDAMFLIFLLIMTKGAKGFTFAKTATSESDWAKGAPPDSLQAG